MNYLTHIATVLAAVSLSSTTVLKAPNNDDGNFELLILHNNDMHARFEQTSQLSGTCTPADREAGKCYGGFPRVAHVVKEARRQAKSGEGPPVLYLNAGDTYTGTAWFTIYKWKIAAEFINALQPDAVALGNNDIEKLSNELSPFLQNLETTILASNVILKSSENKIQKSVILDVEGKKVGLVSYLTPDMGFMDTTGEIEYINEVIALQDEVKKLQEQNVNIIVALGHAHYDKDMEVAYEVQGLDLIIAGHKNIYYWNGTNTNEQVDKAIVVIQRSGRRVPIIPSYSYDKYLGQIDLLFNADGEVSSYDANPILLDSSIVQDVEALQTITSHNAQLASRSQEFVGQTAVVLDGESCGIEECNLGNLIADAINYYYAVHYDGEGWTDAPVTIIPAGAIAASIAPSNRPASVTMGDLMSAIPTESNLVAVNMTGTILLEVLEHAVSTYNAPNPAQELLQLSGIRVVYDLSKEPGSRIISAVVRCWACLVPEFFTIDNWRFYKVLMPAALANGGYGYSMLSELTDRTDLEYDEVTCTAEYIRLRSPVYPEVAGRMQYRGSATIIRSTIILLFVTLIPFIA